jgi:hypothetical protein
VELEKIKIKKKGESVEKDGRLGSAMILAAII